MDVGSDLSTKNLVGRCAREPWRAVASYLPSNYQISAIGLELIDQVDRALFERKLHVAMTSGIIFERWAERDLEFNAKAPAVLASIYAVAGTHSEAEKQIVKAKKRTNPKWIDCQAHYFKRLGTVHLHERAYKKSHHAYDQAARLYRSIGQERDVALSIMNRGVMKCLLRDYDEGLKDEEHALAILRPEFDITTIMCLINIASIYVIQQEIDSAIEKIKETQEMLIGEDDLERPKLILRWIRALLLEAQEKRKDAGEMIDTIDFLTREEVQAILDVIDPQTWARQRDRALLALTAQAGLRRGQRSPA